jgi:hypothetical protein
MWKDKNLKDSDDMLHFMAVQMQLSRAPQPDSSNVIPLSHRAIAKVGHFESDKFSGTLAGIGTRFHVAANKLPTHKGSLQQQQQKGLVNTVMRAWKPK